MAHTKVSWKHRKIRPQREDFSRIPTIVDIPNLIEIQEKSYESFLQYSTQSAKREDKGLEAVFGSVFPITDFNEVARLEYLGYEIGAWQCKCGEYKGLGGPKLVCERCHSRLTYKQKYEVDECRQRGMTYADPLRVLVRLVVSERNEETGELVVRDVKEQKVYLGEIPLMTDKGTFIINGTERVIVSQLHRSPGVFFAKEKSKTHFSGKILYSARIIPYRGSWIDFEFDNKDLLYVRIDRRRKMPATILLRALGMTTQEILHTFFKIEEIKFVSEQLVFNRKVSELLVREKTKDDIVDPHTGEIIVKANRKISKSALKRMQLVGIEEIPVVKEDLIGKILAEDLVDDETGEVIIGINEELTLEVLNKIEEKGFKFLKILHIDPMTSDSSIRDTLILDKINSTEEALLEIYKRLRPGDPPTKETAKTLFNNLFRNPKRYDLSKIGRLKLNAKLGLEFSLDQRQITKEDIVEVLRYLVNLRAGIGNVDDIDHLGNRRVRSVGELLENQFRIGLVRMEKTIRERMSIQNLEMVMPHDLINSKPIIAAVKEFFGSSRLSQFMDQTNPLSEITHKRRLSALGPGGLTRERAGFEVRDVHPTHYGRICPIETPEGPNIGLIASLSTYARVNEFGFIETPYRKVLNGRVTNEVDFLSAIEEDKYVIAQANAELDQEGRLISDLVSCRTRGDFIMATPENIDYMDVSPKQLVSVAASLIPFLENDDANRALMGSNMQRQAVPLLRTEAPLVGTGMEYIAARDSGAIVTARASGTVMSVDASRIVVRRDEVEGSDNNETGVDIYNLMKFQRSNQNTCMNQRSIVAIGDRVSRGDVLADGASTEAGELALGRNILVAFMPWHGYNFEDAIIISEKVVKEDVFTSIHIQEFEVECRETKQGKEEITRDIPNVSEEAMKDLDESGIVRIGAKVKPGDILVGKVTPKGETQLSPEEKLLKAIFGEKAGDVRDSSLTVPPGVEGVVIDVKVFSRKGIDRDARSLSIEEDEITHIEKDCRDEIKIVQEERDKKLRNSLKKQTCIHDLVDPKSGKVIVSAGKKLSAEVLDKVPGSLLAQIQISDDTLQSRLLEIDENAKDQIHILESLLAEKISKLKKADELPPGVIKLVKVYVATKRKLSVGDKMAGRHGNKGVVSIIVPEEDMPFLEDGTHIELVLNPLGVPSRMNVGQILETHLGWAAKALDVHFSTPVFDGATEEDIAAQLHAVGLPINGRAVLCDGRTGESFDQTVVVGQIYMMKLHHLVDDKIHARSTGPYSLVTQQPLGGKAQFGGQRLGEMEVWALEAYGASRTLQEMLTVKSDDIGGRTRMYESIVKGDYTLQASLPESFNVLIKELQSLALDIELLEENSQ
ncbi:MAG: DNA-directed RNA polymerase subunit beta [Candidatus Tectomicrobia bacterium]|uniref:DNA-directed RNA polymerase subunit beta n=1 Tax=Tectimicrobiota bacterium TaxID=2528274 RepID=A0A933GMB1_UNCTE|nr:DNA-directed RNA polymerase subunit beta [Candidatus Tectomicrobia bacterium]